MQRIKDAASHVAASHASLEGHALLESAVLAWQMSTLEVRLSRDVERYRHNSLQALDRAADVMHVGQSITCAHIVVAVWREHMLAMRAELADVRTRGRAVQVADVLLVAWLAGSLRTAFFAWQGIVQAAREERSTQLFQGQAQLRVRQRSAETADLRFARCDETSLPSPLSAWGHNTLVVQREW